MVRAMAHRPQGGLRVRCLFLAGVAFVLTLPGQATAAEPARPNVLLITIDTLRADHLSSYGYHLLTTPRLDRLAAEGVRFERAYTAIPLTGPSHISLLTGRYPQEHGGKVNGQPLAEDPRLVTLAQILQSNNYRTAAYVSAWPLKKRLTRLDRGFEIYDQEFNRQYQLFNSYRSAEDVTPLAIRWMQERAKDSPREPFFLWAHYFDPHKPYHLREEFSHLKPNPGGTYQPAPLNKKMADRIRRYDTEIAYTDHHIGKLLDELETLGLRESTLIIVVADHGESLGERGYVGHGRQLYDNIVRVPLILSYPATIPSGRVVHQHVSLLDVMPTVLDLLGIDFPLSLQGKTLKPFFEDPSRQRAGATYFVTFAGKNWEAPRWLSWMWYVDSRDRLPLKMGWVLEEQKIIWTPRSNKVEVFDVAKDQKEIEPVFLGKTKDRYQRQVNQLLAWFKATAIYRDEPSPLKKKDIEILKSLGYVGD